MDEIKIVKVEDKNSLLTYHSTILDLLTRIYIATGGKYPAMEWLKPEEKPKIGSPDFYERFEEKYGPFLEWRLTKELDELYIAEIDDKLVGVIALNYDLRGKDIPWIPQDKTLHDKAGFIELFAVLPEYQGRGLGRKLFKLALMRLKELNKKPCVVTFPDLEAVNFYKKMGGKLVKSYDVFQLYCF
ncbi:MAG: GNAT family N-acetyltransferase [Candidatus Njordarchaeia archaeon]